MGKKIYKAAYGGVRKQNKKVLRRFCKEILAAEVSTALLINFIGAIL
jgi:hypothetical protein